MILTMRVLNSDAELNHFEEFDSAPFIPGSALTLVLRLMQTERPLRYVPDAAATVNVNFLKSDGTTLVKAATFLDTADRSIIVVQLTSVETQTLIGQNLTADITEPGPVVSKAFLQYALKNISLGC